MYLEYTRGRNNSKITVRWSEKRRVCFTFQCKQFTSKANPELTQSKHQLDSNSKKTKQTQSKPRNYPRSLVGV